MNPKKMARKILRGNTGRAAEETYRKSRVYTLQALNLFPAKKLKVIAVTGTNGKTTTCAFINSMLKDAGYNTAMFTTALVEIGGKEELNRIHRTVPLTTELVKFLRTAKSKKVDYVILETTSHALHQHKMIGIPIEVAVMTNLTQDHLDYHGSMEGYATAKARLFNKYLDPKWCVLNHDDEWYDYFKNQSVGKVMSYGKHKDSTLKMSDIQLSQAGTKLNFKYDSAEYSSKIQLVGAFNAYNASAAVAVALALGIELPKALKGIENLEAVPGRMELVSGSHNFGLIVDYAHTADALKNVLQTLRDITSGKVIVVFGATGDRDRSKRPVMGKVTAELADKIFLTDDEPYTENAEQIRKAVLQGIKEAGGAHKTVEIGDRLEAIRSAIRFAKKGDVILLAGLGHQDYRGMNEGNVPWDDREVAKTELKSL